MDDSIRSSAPPAVERDNGRILKLMSAFLNGRAVIGAGDVQEMVEAFQIPRHQAYSLLLAAACGLDIAENPEDRRLYHNYFPHMVRELNARAYALDPYYAGIEVPPAIRGKFALTRQHYAPFEAFVCDDLMALPDGRILPQIGYFEGGFSFPAMLEGGRVWMTVTPNEIETMKESIAAARGHVLALGLGLGYYAFMASQRGEVESVTVVERSGDVIGLFAQHLLPQFPHGEKIRIVQGDAFDYLEDRVSEGRYDVVFADLWHDVADGLSMYRRITPYEDRAPGTVFLYWIEKTMKCYL